MTFVALAISPHSQFFPLQSTWKRIFITKVIPTSRANSSFVTTQVLFVSTPLTYLTLNLTRSSSPCHSFMHVQGASGGSSRNNSAANSRQNSKDNSRAGTRAGSVGRNRGGTEGRKNGPMSLDSAAISSLNQEIKKQKKKATSNSPTRHNLIMSSPLHFLPFTDPKSNR